MFLVSDGTRKNRKTMILKLAAKDKAVGLLLSVVDFEWTIRRVILKLSRTSTKSVRAKLATCHGVDEYKRIWRECLVADKSCPVLDSITDVINGRDNSKGKMRPWDALLVAFKARHLLVHGVNGFIKDSEAEQHMLNVLTATDMLASFCEQSGCNVFERIKTRR